MKKIGAILLGIAVLSTACERTHFTEEIATIDSLLVKLDSVDMMHRKIDTSGFTELGRNFSENLAYLQQAYTESEDTIPKNVGMLLADYRSLKKPAKGFIDKYQRLGEEIEFSKAQLADLKHDAQNNLLDSILVSEMLDDERQAAAKVESSVEELKMSSTFSMAKNAELEPRIDSLIQVLKKDKS